MTRVDLELPITPFVFFVRRFRGPPRGEAVGGRPAPHRLYGLWRQREGTTTLVRAGERVELRPGGVGLSEPGMRITLGPGARASYCAFSLLPRIRQVRGAGEVTINVDEPPEPAWRDLVGRPLPVLVPPPAATAARELVDEIELDYWRGPPQRFAAALRVGAWLCKLIADDAPPPADDLMQRFDDLVAQRYPQPVTVADLARELGVSTSLLTQRSRAKRSDTPGRALRARRLAEARALLFDDRDLSLAEIAGRVGYRDRNAFIRAFRQHHGIPPLRWRRGRRRRPG